MAAIKKQILSTTSDVMQLVYQEDWVPMKPTKTIFQNDF